MQTLFTLPDHFRTIYFDIFFHQIAAAARWRPPSASLSATATYSDCHDNRRSHYHDCRATACHRSRRHCSSTIAVSFRCQIPGFKPFSLRMKWFERHCVSEDPQPPPLPGGTQLMIEEEEPDCTSRQCNMCGDVDEIDTFQNCSKCGAWGCPACVNGCIRCEEEDEELVDQAWCDDCFRHHECGVRTCSFMRCECCNTFQYDETSDVCSLCGWHTTCCTWECTTCSQLFCRDCIDPHTKRHHSDKIVVAIKATNTEYQHSTPRCSPKECGHNLREKHLRHCGSRLQLGWKLNASLAFRGDLIFSKDLESTDKVKDVLWKVACELETQGHLENLDQPEILFLIGDNDKPCIEWWENDYPLVSLL